MSVHTCHMLQKQLAHHRGNGYCSPEADHLHTFESWSAAQMAYRAVTNDVDCTHWEIQGHSILTIGCLESVQGGWDIDSTDPEAAWASRLHRDGAVDRKSVV